MDDDLVARAVDIIPEAWHLGVAGDAATQHATVGYVAAPGGPNAAIIARVLDHFGEHDGNDDWAAISECQRLDEVSPTCRGIGAWKLLAELVVTGSTGLNMTPRRNDPAMTQPVTGRDRCIGDRITSFTDSDVVVDITEMERGGHARSRRVDRGSPPPWARRISSSTRCRCPLLTKHPSATALPGGTPRPGQSQADGRGGGDTCHHDQHEEDHGNSNELGFDGIRWQTGIRQDDAQAPPGRRGSRSSERPPATTRPVAGYAYDDLPRRYPVQI
ncbi:hypothetical protein [Gordonia bronchialis]|uniref:hypothetical protein n=1 Tax=Gordonia bronchialis TaxID=2054 RepID=UPI00242D8FAF|nr:hypothetical protein [Gordonia bronchialis]